MASDGPSTFQHPWPGPPGLYIGRNAPQFDVPSVLGDETLPINNETFEGKWLVLLFYSMDFSETFPVELMSFSERLGDFQQLNTCVVGVSSCKKPRGGLPPCNVPLVVERHEAMLSAFGMLPSEHPDVPELCGLLIIGPLGKLRHVSIHDMPILRSVDETLRIVAAYQRQLEAREASLSSVESPRRNFKVRQLDLPDLMQMNRDWAERVERTQPGFFRGLAATQSPRFLWIGCSDSRVPANTVVGLRPGEVFVHRNVANQVNHTDFNALSVVQFAIDVLKVEHILVVGHYGCGGVAASVGDASNGLVDNWLRNIRDIYRYKAHELKGLPTEAQLNRLCELNVIRQALNMGQTTVVQDAWKRGQRVHVHALVYGLKDGLLVNCNVSMATAAQVREINEMYLRSTLPVPTKLDEVVGDVAPCACDTHAAGEAGSSPATTMTRAAPPPLSKLAELSTSFQQLPIMPPVPGRAGFRVRTEADDGSSTPTGTELTTPKVVAHPMVAPAADPDLDEVGVAGPLS